MTPQSKISEKLTNIIFSNLNYLGWVREVKISFKGRGKFEFVTDTTKKPPLSLVPTIEELKAQGDWEMRDQ
jgi:hypothetical protein